MMGNNVLIMPVFHQETALNNANPGKTELFIQEKGRFIRTDYRIELQYLKAQIFALFHAVFHQNFTDPLAAFATLDGITGITDMPATPDVIGVEDIKPDHFAGFFLNGDAHV